MHFAFYLWVIYGFLFNFIENELIELILISKSLEQISNFCAHSHFALVNR